MSDGLFLDSLGRSTATRDYGAADRETTSRASMGENRLQRAALLISWSTFGRLTYVCVTVTLGLSSSLHLFANEPSLALFRLEEHVRKSVPKLVKIKVCWFFCLFQTCILMLHPAVQHQTGEQCQQLDGVVQDTTYAISYV